ncbi:MAG: YdeI/OmpD-associated family protein [Planctomycetota bacterium]|nr:YdeI/OmpD-associated family protein [Planctomycetota bacterium]
MILKRYIRIAMKLNDDGVRVVRAKTRPKKLVVLHPDFKAALARSAAARAVFEALGPSAKSENVEWIADAKADDTRERRIAQALEWISAGKQRNWKYQKSR